jgi:hypothetical protein
MGLTNFPNGITSFGIPIYGGGVPQGIPCGTVYCVDGNSGSDSKKNAGESFDNPLKTLSAAISASHNDIARGSDRWARRNVIFAAGDAFDEDLTAFPQKTDIIGVGSYNNKPMPGLIGTHAITTTSQFGTRWFNFEFLDDGATANFTMTGGGYEFHNCVFRCDAHSTHGITGTAPSDVKIIGCQFLQDVDGDPFDTAAIAFTTAGYNLQIRNNLIYGDIGIALTDSGTFDHGIIDNNIIHATAVTIDDNSDDFIVTNNILISDASATDGTSYGEVIDINAAKAANNYLTCANLANVLYPTVDTTT